MLDENNSISDSEERADEIDIETVDEEGLLTPQARVKKFRDELKKCIAERKEYLDGWQRAKADHINYRKDEGSRFEDMARFVSSGLIQDMLPVLDSFELALGHGVSPEVEKGVLLIRSQLMDALKKRGFVEIHTDPGDAFNPEIHESLGEVKSDKPPGAVAEIVQRGYTLQGKVLRPMRVKLAYTKQE
jgi:molecular chaperone GrpE